MDDTVLDPQTVYSARCQAISDVMDRMPAALQSFVWEHLEAVKQADRLRASHMAYVLAFVEGVEALAHHLLSLPTWQPPRIADQKIRGSGI